MAERTPRGRRLPGRALLPVLFGLAFAPSSRADVTFTPSVTLKETWTDNVNLLPADQARRQFVTEISPAFTVLAKNQRMDLAARYQYRHFVYSDKDAPNLRNGGSELGADLKARLVEDLLFLDASASRGQQAASAFGPALADNSYTTSNRTDVSTWRISPSLAHRFGSSANLLASYTRDSVKTGRTGYGDTDGDSVSLALSSPGERRIGWNLRYDRQHLSEDMTGDSSSYNAQAGLSWRVKPSFALNASGGYDSYDYNGLGSRTSGKNWNVGYQYTPSPRTSLTMSYGQRYFGKSRALSALHRSRHTVWNISYNEAVTTTRQQFLLPATVDTASLLDRLFLPNFPDAVLRRQAVEAYLRSSGLPPSLANDINYLSNRYMLQHQFQATAGFNGARSVFMVTLFDTRREALSVQQSDSPLLGNNQLSLNDNTRQRGAALSLSYRMSPRSDAYASLDASRAVSLATDIRQSNRSLRVGLNRQFQRRLLGTVELRRLQGSTGGSATSYTENAVSATLSMTL